MIDTSLDRHVCVLSWVVTCLESISHFTIAKEHKLVTAMSKRKLYNVSFKLKAVECAEKKSKEAAVREMGVDSKRINKWCKQKQMLASLKKKGASSRKWQCGAGRKALDVNLEDALFSWILELSSRNIHMSRKMIRQQARSLSSAKDFHASKG